MLLVPTRSGNSQSPFYSLHKGEEHIRGTLEMTPHGMGDTPWLLYAIGLWHGFLEMLSAREGYFKETGAFCCLLRDLK